MREKEKRSHRGRKGKKKGAIREEATKRKARSASTQEELTRISAARAAPRCAAHIPVT